MKTSFFYLASNGIWKWAAATYLLVRQALREPFVPSGGGEGEVKPSAAAGSGLEEQRGVCSQVA